MSELLKNCKVHWLDIIQDLRRAELKSPDLWKSFDPPTRNAVRKCINEMIVSPSRDKVAGFDCTKWMDGIGRLETVNQERLVWAHATLYPKQHPDMVATVETLDHEEACDRCERTIFVGALVFRAESGMLCIPCRQKSEAAKAKADAKKAKESRKN